MLYTRKGDGGTTKDLHSKPGERKSKSSCQTEALGALDELNSFLGLVKVKSADAKWSVLGTPPAQIIGDVQNNLFSVQAEMAGADKRVGTAATTGLERFIDAMEKEMPPIKTFFISGGTELAALFDISRTLARKAERRVIAAREAGEINPDSATLSFLNRLSSLLYACARFSNFKSGVSEKAPWYN